MHECLITLLIIKSLVKQTGVKGDGVIRMMQTLSYVLKTAGFVHSTKLLILGLAL